jgi:hypothetical protein
MLFIILGFFLLLFILTYLSFILNLEDDCYLIRLILSLRLEERGDEARRMAGRSLAQYGI